METLRQAVLPRTDIKFESLTRFFYKIYPYKVVIDLQKYVPVSSASKGRNMSFAQQNAARQAAIDGCNIENYKYRTDYGFCGFFFLTEADTLTFIAKNKDHITTIVAPRHEGDLTTLKDDHKVRIRNSLYFNKYRWCITLKSGRYVKIDDVRKWYDENFQFSSEAERRKRVEWSYGFPRRVYLADDTDAVMLKIAFSDGIASIEKALLKSEIDDEQPSSHEVD